MTNQKPRVAVVGSGFGGLSAACYLASAGFDVTVLEKNEQLGGRASVLEIDGFRFDMGPSWYLMPDVFERFFNHFDRVPATYYDLVRLDPNYRIFFKGGEKVDIPARVDAAAALFENYESGAGEQLRNYLEGARRSYHVGMEHFVYTDRPRIRDYLDPTVAKEARHVSLFRSMGDHVNSYFNHPKLRQIMQYSLVFLGGSPHNTPAMYNLMNHVDFTLGVHYPTGGIGRVVDSIAALGTELGVQYRTDWEVASISGRAPQFRVTSVDGKEIQSGAVVSNADYRHTEQSLLEPQHRQYDADYWSSRVLAPSAYLLYLGVEGQVDEFEHHTLVLPTDWDPHFKSIFDDHTWPTDPAYYICHPSATDPDVAPPGHAALFVLVPIAPGLPDGSPTREQFKRHILADIRANTGVKLEDRIVVEQDFCVADFTDRYHATNGTALGLSHTLRQTGPLRPRMRSAALSGLYFVGGYTRPGIGVPMCLISGEHVASMVLSDGVWTDE